MTASFPALLGLLFIGLKLGGLIHWSWLWVLAPFWLGYALLLVATLAGLGIVAAIAFFTR